MWRTNDELATKLILMVQDMILPNFLEDREIIALKCKVADTLTTHVAQPMVDELVPLFILWASGMLTDILRKLAGKQPGPFPEIHRKADRL